MGTTCFQQDMVRTMATVFCAMEKPASADDITNVKCDEVLFLDCDLRILGYPDPDSPLDLQDGQWSASHRWTRRCLMWMKLAGCQSWFSSYHFQPLILDIGLPMVEWCFSTCLFVVAWGPNPEKSSPIIHEPPWNALNRGT